MFNDTTIPASASVYTSQRPLARRIAGHAPTAGRVLFGLMFFVFGLNGFLEFIPPPSTPMPERAVAFGVALMQTGYMFPLIKGTELVAGALLLANRFVPLALALLAPVVLNIFLYHAVLTPGDSTMATLVLLIELALAWSYRAAYRPMLAARTDPSGSSTSDTALSRLHRVCRR